MSVDNFDQIRNMLEWRSDDDFYFIQILQRKKDHKDIKVNGCNNNSRTIKTYYVKSLEHFDFIKPEIIQLCEIFGARGSINLNRRSFKKTALQHLKKCTDQILNENFNKAHKAYSTVVGSYMQESDKRWILDIDDDTAHIDVLISKVIWYINTQCRPEGEKLVDIIRSKSGAHIITKPFDLSEFRKRYPEIEVHKNNPTNLYIP